MSPMSQCGATQPTAALRVAVCRSIGWIIVRVIEIFSSLVNRIAAEAETRFVTLYGWNPALNFGFAGCCHGQLSCNFSAQPEGSASVKFTRVRHKQRLGRDRDRPVGFQEYLK